MCDESVVNFFCNVLKERDQIHYSELLGLLQCSDSEKRTFFESYTDYGRRWFFQVNSSLFRINDDGYVSLVEGVKELVASGTRDSSQKENGQTVSLVQHRNEQPDAEFELLSNVNSVELVIERLVSVLSEHGSMHFLDLANHQSNETKINIAHYFKPLSSLEKFLFFRNRPHMFSIDDKGCVTLRTHAPELCDGGRRKKTAIETVADYFTSILRIKYKMNHRKLVKHLQESNLDEKYYFDSYSDDQLRNFFKKQSSRFHLEFYTSVRLQEEAGDCAAPDEVEEAKSTQKERNCGENIVYEEKFFRPSKITNEKALVKCFVSTLRECGPMHYNALSLCAKKKARFFKRLTAFDKISFFEKHSSTFSIGNNGYVSLNNEVGGILQEEKTKENQIIEFFVSILRCKQRMFCNDLVKILQNSELDAKSYFRIISGHKLTVFFKKHCSVFRIEKHAYISLQENTAEFSEEYETSKVSEADELENTRIIGRDDICFPDEEGDCEPSSASSDSRSTSEEAVVETLVAALLEYGSMHYSALLKCAYVCPGQSRVYLHELSKNDAFFRTHPDTFRIVSDGRVALTDLSLNTVKPKETEVLDYFTSLLKKSRRLPPQALLKRIKKSGLSFRDYFDSFSFGDIINFFEDHPSRFLLQDEINVSLPVGVIKYAEQEDSDYAKRCDDVETAKVKGISDVSDVDSSISIHTEDRKYCGREEISVLKTDKVQNKLFAEGSVSYEAENSSDCTFNFGDDQEILSGCLVGNAGYSCCSNLSTTSAVACSYKTSDSKYDSKLDSFAFPEGKKGKNKGISKNKISECQANHGKKNRAIVDAFSGSTTLKNSARPDLLCTNSASGCSFEARSFVKAQNVPSSIDQKLKSTGVVHLKNIFSLTDTHVQSIRYFVIVLKDSSIVHYQQLLYKACSYDRYTFNFFSKFTLADVLEFIRMHSMYFSVQDDGNVTLVDPTVAPSKVLISEDDVLQVASLLDAKAVEFFVNCLLQGTKIAIIELKFYLGFAPGYVLSFFVANYRGDDFLRFFQRHSSYFRICNDEYVELI